MLIASVSLINFCWLVFLGFCRTTHDIYEPIITWTLITYCNLPNRGIFWIVIASFYFINCCLGWCLLGNDAIKVGNFSWNFSCLNVVDCLYLNCCCWHESQTFSEKSHIWAHNHILLFIAYWRHQKLGRFLFCLKLIPSAYLKKCCGFSKFLCKKLSRNL